MVPMRMVCPKRCRASMSVPLILCPASTRLSVVTPVMVAWKASPETLVRTSSARSILAISRSRRSTAGPEAAIVLVSRSYAVSLMLGALEDATGQAATEATGALPDAAADASPDFVAVLLEAGAHPKATDADRGLSALRRARCGPVKTRRRRCS